MTRNVAMVVSKPGRRNAAPMTIRRRRAVYASQRLGAPLTDRQLRQCRRMETRELARRGLLTVCQDKCRAHDEWCALEQHTRNVPHRCGRCPWPASNRMVRHG